MARAEPKQPARARAFRNRIVDHGEEDPAEIQMHPANWRRHPEHQARSLRDVMDQIGVVDEVIINRRSGRLLNGHLRVQLAREEGHGSIPVKYVDLSEEEERIILFSFDATSAMATVDEEALRALAAEIPDEEEWVRALMAETGREYGIDFFAAPGEDGEDIVGRAGGLTEDWGAPPFSVFDARQGWWQERKRQWLALGIQSELGRGQNVLDMSASMAGISDPDERREWNEKRRNSPRRQNAIPGGAPMPPDRGADYGRAKRRLSPGGSPMPATDYGKSKARGDGRGRALKDG